jgi:hypothetical protein
MKGYLPELEYSGWGHDGIAFESGSCLEIDSENHSRLLLCAGFSDEFQSLIQQERTLILKNPNTELVHYQTGAKFDRQRHKLEIETEELSLANCKTVDCSSVNSVQVAFLNYFNSLDTNSFSKMVSKNLASTIELAESFPFKNEKVRERNLRILGAIKQCPKPFYHAVDSTCRLFANPGAPTYLKRELRKELTKGWVEFDITNCHLAIVAKDWDVPALIAFLKTGESFWSYLENYLPGASTVAKPQLKPIIYALVYGDSKKQMKESLVKAGLSKAKADRFFTDIPLIHDIYQARNRALAMALTSTIDCFGNPCRVLTPKGIYDQKPHRSILAQKAQAVELKMLAPLIEFSLNNPNVMLATLYQFDGFSCVVKQPSRINQHCRRLKKILDQHIAEMGYPAHVEYTINT